MSVWKASVAYTLAKAQKAGDDARVIAIGYLLGLSKADPTCSRRDSRRQGLPLATAIHGYVWKACLDRSAALPADTARGEWDKAIKAVYEIALAAYADKAAAAKADRDKKAEEPKAESDVPGDLAAVTAAVAALLKAICALPVEQRPMVARRACSEIMRMFE